MAVTTAAVVAAGASVAGAVNSRNAGKRAAGAARESAQLQADSAREARDQMERLNKPYLELGESAIPGLQQFIDDPTGFNYLNENPMFNAAVDYGSERIENYASAGGRLNSGGTIDQIFKNYMATGDQLVNSGFQRAMAPVQLGQSSANFQGANAANLITGAGNAQAAGIVGAGNAKAAGINNAVGILGQTLGGSLQSDPYGWRTGGYGGIKGDPFA